MKIEKRYIFTCLTLILILFSISIRNNIQNFNKVARENLDDRTSDLKSAGFWNNFTFIHITNLNWSTASSYDWCSGAGTWDDPYVIENMIMNASASPTGAGIFIENSVNDYFIIRNVTIFETTNGIKLENTNKGTLNDNFLSNNNESGIYLVNCVNNTISRNELINNDMYAVHLYSNCLNNKITGNTVKDNGVNFGDAGIYLANICNDNEIKDNNVFDNYVYGINLENSCVGNLIYNNTLKNIVSYQQDYGIRLNSACNQNNISRNLIDNIDNYGIYLVTSDLNYVSNNQIFNTNNGLYMLLADQNDVISNTISGGSLAISISGSFENNVIGNFINDTANYGIRLYTNCDGNEFYDNIIIDNNGFGVQFYRHLSDHNLFYRNSFISNGMHVFDNGTVNFWNNSVIGNYWDNYTGMDLNMDHIGDTLFNIPGGANSNDSLPIFDHGAPSITINTPTADEYNDTAPEFNIFIDDPYIYSMWYKINNSGKKYYFTKNGTINQEAWNALSNGNLTITFYARDIAWNLGSTSIVITKGISQGPEDPDNLDDGPPPINMVFIIVITVIIIAVIVIAGILMRSLQKKGKTTKLRKLDEEQLSNAQYIKDVTSILTVLAIHNESGLCLSKFALHGGIGLDEHLFTGFISAIGSFKNELAKQMGLHVKGEGGDNVIAYNEFTITLMDGEYLRLGLVSYSSLGEILKVKCGQVLRSYELKHVEDLKNFEGEVQIFDDFKETIEAGLDLHLNKKCIINVKHLNKYNAPESLKEVLNDFKAKSDGFYPAEIAVALMKDLNMFEQEAYFTVYEAYKNQIFLPTKLE